MRRSLNQPQVGARKLNCPASSKLKSLEVDFPCQTSGVWKVDFPSQAGEACDVKAGLL